MSLVHSGRIRYKRTTHRLRSIVESEESEVAVASNDEGDFDVRGDFRHPITLACSVPVVVSLLS